MRKLIVALLGLFVALPLAAQNTDIESLSGLQFNFGNPGARSLGMGGAFLGLADDASAAEANPAGLTILRRPEFTIEGRNYETVQTFAVSGTFPDITSQEFNAFSRRAEVNFGSFVLPVGNFAVAGYYHLPLRFENNINNLFSGTPIEFYLGPTGPVSEDDCGEDCSGYELYPFYTQVDIELQTWGLAAAWKLGNLSLGVAGRYQQFEENALTFRTDIPELNRPLQPLTLVGQVAKEDDITYSVGFKWQANERFSAGGVYKTGAEFDAPLYFQNLQAGTPIELVATPAFHVPDIYGVGISVRPIPVLTINVDAVNVAYSNLADDFVSVFTGLSGADYSSEDVLELHAGAELFFTTRYPIALRGGWWRDPAHQLEFTGALTEPNRVAARILYPGSEDEDHYAVGVGVSFTRFQIDAAYDTSDNFKVGSISMVTRF